MFPDEHSEKTEIIETVELSVVSRDWRDGIRELSSKDLRAVRYFMCCYISGSVSLCIVQARRCVTPRVNGVSTVEIG